MGVSVFSASRSSTNVLSCLVGSFADPEGWESTILVYSPLTNCKERQKIYMHECQMETWIGYPFEESPLATKVFPMRLNADVNFNCHFERKKLIGYSNKLQPHGSPGIKSSQV